MKKNMKSASNVIFYASPDGDDRNDGRSPKLGKNGSGPFATLERIRDAIRQIRKADPAARCEARLRGGTYFLPRTFELSPDDSGSQDSPALYAAFPGERPIISGGRRIEGWTTETFNGKDCWTTEIPEARNGGWIFTQLFVNGQRCLRPRLPKKGYFHFASVPDGASGEGRFGHGPDRARFKPGDVSAEWHDLDAVDLVSLELWFSTHHKIKRVDPALSEMEFRNRSLGQLREAGGTEFARYWVENVRESLSEPGEWYLDRKTGRVIYLPLPHESLETAEIVAPLLESIIRFSGGRERQTEHVRLENIFLHHAEWLPPEDFAGSIQAANRVPGAVVFENAEHCSLHGCQIAHVNQYGVQIGHGCHACEVTSCEITDMGAGGVRVDHEWLTKINLQNPVPIEAPAGGKPSAALVANCSIHDGTLIYPGAIGVWIGNAGRVRILDNHIYNLNYTGISSGWTWSYEPTATVGNRIEGNHVHNICWGGPLCDNGGIYLLGRHPGGVVARNHIHHCDGNGIYLDEGSSHLTVEDNITHHTEVGFLIHYGHGNVVRNNIFALFSQRGFTLGRVESERSCRFERNIILSTKGQPGGGVRDVRNWLTRDCLIWMAGLPREFAAGASMEQWQRQGQLAGCVIADPLFFDPEGGDFTLRSDSPALKLGFRPITARHPRQGATPNAITTSILEWTSDSEFALTIHNHGPVPASGSLRLTVGPEGSVKLKESGDLPFSDLPPGQTLTTVFHVEVKRDAESVFAETIPGSEELLPVFVSRAKEPRIELCRVQTPATPKGVAEALASTPWRALKRPAGAEAAKWKLAVAGKDSLLFQIQAPDIRQVTSTVPWQSSSVEFYAAPGDATDSAKLTQLILVPGPAWSGLTAFRIAKGIPVQEPLIQGDCLPLDNVGYDLRVIVPLSVVDLRPELSEFLFELMLNATLASGQGLAGNNLFGARCACRGTTGYGRMVVK